MKKIIFAVIALTFIACGSPKQNKEEKSAEKTMAEKDETTTINREVPDEEDGGNMLLGEVNKEAFSKEPYSEWFQANAEFHTLDTATVKKIKPLLKDVKITAFMGSWCSDSQREIPAFYKIMEYVDYDFDNLTMYAMDHQKLTEEGYENTLDINYVPTLIFYRDGEEIGRFVEHARESLEKDIYAIVSEADYKHSYEE